MSESPWANGPDARPHNDMTSYPEATPEPKNPEVYEDYWGVGDSTQHFLPDGKQYFVIRQMTEGDRAAYEKATNRGMIANAKSDDVRIEVDPAADRLALIMNAVEDWYLLQKGNPIAFQDRVLRQWVMNARPDLVDKLTHAIRMHNPFLAGELDLDSLYEQRKELDDLIAAKEREDAKN